MLDRNCERRGQKWSRAGAGAINGKDKFVGGPAKE